MAPFRRAARGASPRRRQNAEVGEPCAAVDVRESLVRERAVDEDFAFKPRATFPRDQWVKNKEPPKLRRRLILTNILVFHLLPADHRVPLPNRAEAARTITERIP